MAFRRYVVPVVLFVAVVGIAFATMAIADVGEKGAARTAESVTNETIVQEVGMWQFVNKALDDDTAGFNESVTVFNNSSAELVRGTDYLWNATDGSIKYLNTANVTDGATGNISYAYFQNTQRVGALSRVLDPAVTLVSWSPLAVGGLALGLLLLAAVAILARAFGNSGPETNR